MCKVDRWQYSIYDFEYYNSNMNRFFRTTPILIESLITILILIESLISIAVGYFNTSFLILIESLILIAVGYFDTLI